MQQPYIIFVMGVSGSGKTTIGRKLAERIRMPFFEGDDFHSEANKQKMKAGHPLNDEDRAGWLRRLNELAREHMKKDGAVIACSALKEKYRTVLCAHIITPVFWVFLKGSYELIRKRMEERTGHYMPVSLLESQFATLEEPTDAITVDTAKSPDEIVEIIVSEITKKEHLKSLN